MQSGQASGIVLAKGYNQRPEQAGFRLVHFFRHQLLQFAKTGVEGRARRRVKPLKLLDALKNLGSHRGAERPHTVQAKGMVAAKGVFQIGHGFLKGVPCREKQAEGVVPQGKKALGFLRRADGRRGNCFVAPAGASR